MAKRKSGPRTAKGRRKDRTPSRVMPNDKVLERAAMFAWTHRRPEQLYDPVGRLEAVGLLDNQRVDSGALCDAGREYARARAAYFPTSQGVTNYLRECRRGVELAPGETDRAGLAFLARQKRLAAAGRRSVEAVFALCFQTLGRPDEDPLWVERLINERFLLKGRPVAGLLPTADDRAQLDAAISGLLALCEGVSTMRRAA